MILAFAGCVHPSTLECWVGALIAGLLSAPVFALLPVEEPERPWVPEPAPDLKIEWRAILGLGVAILACYLIARYGMAAILRLV